MLLKQKIHDLLINEWDPIGVGDEPEAQDEYDCYIPGIIKKLQSSADSFKLTEYLQNIETVNMGLAPTPKRNKSVALLLVEIYDAQT